MFSFVDVLKIMPAGADLFLLITNDYLESGQYITFGDITQVTKILRDFDVEASVTFATGFDSSIQIVMDGDKVRRLADGYVDTSDELSALEQLCNLYCVSAYYDPNKVYELSHDLVIIDEWEPKENDNVCTE